MDGEYQGSRTFLREIYNLLSKTENIEVYLGAHNICNLEQNFGEAKNIRFIKYKSRSSFPRLLIDIPKLISKYKFDFAHFQYILPLTKSCRFILSTHDVLFKEYPAEFDFVYRKVKGMLFKKSIRQADIITTVSAYSRNSLHKYFGIDKEKINVVSNGVNGIFFQPYNEQQEKDFIKNKYGLGKFILYVSRFEPRKNHDLLLTTFLDLRLHLRGFHLVLLGARTMATPEFDKTLKGLPPSIKSSIFMNDKINDDELVKFYRAADVFVYPSKAEGFGIPPLEAAASKTPVLCSNSSAMCEFDFFRDYQFNPFDAGEFKRKLEQICFNPIPDMLLNQIARIIKETYSWEKSAEKFYQLIQSKYLL
jgi:glycosyltransferase involved in cell wall biosynthesis